MHASVLFIHSLLRWVVLAAGLYAVGAAVGRSGRAGRWFAILLDIQVVIGLIVYWLSPITSSALANMGAAMQNRVVRFWAVEHGFSMLVAVALAHIGLARAKKGKGGAALLYLLALVAVLIGIPWPFLPYGRPLIPMP
ncbi:MAG: hypothetical protein ACRDFA_11970 [bacterium]